MGKSKSKTNLHRASLKIVLLLGLLLMGYQNCTSYNEGNLFEAGQLLSASQSSPNDVRLDSPSGVIDIPAAIKLNNFVSLTLGGDCNVGLSKKHLIEIRMMDSQNTPVPVRVDNRCPANQPGLPGDCFVADYFRCEHGRYYVHLPLHCGMFRGETQSLYKIFGQMVTVDENGVETRDNKAQFERFLTIGWPPGC